MQTRNYAGQFSLISVLASQLSPNADFQIDLPQTIQRLLLPPLILLDSGAEVANPQPGTQCILGIRINDPRAPLLAFGTDPYLISEVKGPIDRIFVRYVHGDTTVNWNLLGLNAMELKYSGELYAGLA